MNLKSVLHDYRAWFLMLALLTMLILFAFPLSQQKRPVYSYIFVIDITRSMNAVDYKDREQSLSRLQFVKQNLRELLLKLPCQTKVGLGLFTERRSTLLFEPLEVCSAYAEIDAAISQIDWRMAWAADSNIAKGLFNTLDMLKNRDSAVIFVTDGQEAPPVNPNYATDFSALKSKVKGMIIGAGDLVAVPIPKFNAQGQPTGFYGQDDVPHRSSFGQSNLDPAQIEGYNARNAPFGSKAATGNEHLSALQETYLQKLANESGLAYSRLTDLPTLQENLQIPELADWQVVTVDIRWRMAGVALLLLVLVYVPDPLLRLIKQYTLSR
ncbi:MAG: vWA domain-containing protein [Methylococcales bacterium]